MLPEQELRGGIFLPQWCALRLHKKTNISRR